MRQTYYLFDTRNKSMRKLLRKENVIHMSQEVVIAIIGGMLGSTGLWQLIQYFLNKNSAEREMLLGLGYTQLMQTCNVYLQKGYIEVEELVDLKKYLYEPYRKLGGNGAGEMIMSKVEKLPNRPQSEAA
jgi:hypothetical protein